MIDIKLWLFCSNIWGHLDVCRQMIGSKLKYLKVFNCVQIKMSSGSFKNVIYYMLINHV